LFQRAKLLVQWIRLPSALFEGLLLPFQTDSLLERTEAAWIRPALAQVRLKHVARAHVPIAVRAAAGEYVGRQPLVLLGVALEWPVLGN